MRLTFTTKSVCSRTKYRADEEPAVTGSGPIRVNERDKKLGAHCIVWVLSDKVRYYVHLVQQIERIAGQTCRCRAGGLVLYTGSGCHRVYVPMPLGGGVAGGSYNAQE